jgi:hypothetical protein
MSSSSAFLRRALIVASTISVLVVFASCIGVAGSFIRPTLGLHQLYRISTLTRTAGFCFLATYIVAGFAFPSKAARTSLRASDWVSRVLKIICGTCILLVMLSPHTYIYPAAAGWITKSKAGTFGVSDDVAREYLWRAVRMWSSIPLGIALLVIDFTRRFLRQPASKLTSSVGN